jgi:hypothetical protein
MMQRMRHGGLRAGLLSSVVFVAFAAVSPVGASVPRGDAAPETTPLDVVIAVDESASLSNQDVVSEIEAASRVAQSGLNPRTRVTVLGFGSNNGSTGQEAATEVCRPTVVDSAVNQQYLADCVNKLHRRTTKEGSDTDFAAAMAKALSYFGSGSPSGAVKVVFLMTDGRLDVHNSPNYGSGDRNQAAQQELNNQLATAKNEKIQVWPLGFGSDVDRPSLNTFAAAGSQQACDARPESRPRARVVHDSSDALDSLYAAYAAASCSGISGPDRGSISGGQQRSLNVNIPVIATDGTITVTKGSPKVRVDYKDPTGVLVPSSGTYDGSQFERSGEDSRTEALRIRNPQPGNWTVKLTAPDGLSRQLVSATALWQGAVRSSIVVEPPSARTGQHMTVRLSLLTSRGAITDTSALSAMRFGVTVSGDGVSGGVFMRDDGKGADDRAGDGRYSGGFTAPGAAGDLTFIGTVSGYGIRAENLPVNVKVSATGAIVQSRVEFGGSSTVLRGGSVHGRILSTNGTGQSQNARLLLDAPVGARATTSLGKPFTLPSGDSTKPFTLRIGRDAEVGGTSMVLRVVDNTNAGVVYGNGQLTVVIRKPPGFVERHQWEIGGAVALAVVLLAYGWFRRRARRARADVRGLSAELQRDGDQIGARLKAPSKWADQFRFAIRDLDGQYPRLDYPRPQDRAYVAWRGSGGQITVRTPGGEKYDITLGGHGEALTNGYLLVFHERPRGRRSPGPSAEQNGARGPAPSEAPAARPERTADEDSDPWL